MTFLLPKYIRVLPKLLLVPTAAMNSRIGQGKTQEVSDERRATYPPPGTGILSIRALIRTPHKHIPTCDVAGPRIVQHFGASLVANFFLTLPKFEISMPKGPSKDKELSERIMA